MRIDVLTLFPEMFSPLDSSLMGKARQKGLFELYCHNVRDYSADKHKKCDDAPFGGGAGMVMMPQPIHDCIMAVDPLHEAKRIYLSPRGKVFNQQMAKQLSQESRLLFLCGHYEGVDQRVLDMDVDGLRVAVRAAGAGKQPKHRGGILFFGTAGISPIHPSAKLFGNAGAGGACERQPQKHRRLAQGAISENNGA